MEISYQEPKNINPLHLEADRDVPTKKWSDLPTDVLLSILRYLNLKTDLPRLRGVCLSWRSVLPDPTKLPIVSPIQVPSPVGGSNKPLSLAKSLFNLLSPILPCCKAGDGEVIVSIPATPTRWLARMVEAEPNKWHLLNPLNVQDLFMTFPPVRGTISLCDCRILELAAAYSLIDASGDKVKVTSKKVVTLLMSNFEEEDLHLIVLALLEGGELVMWRKGDEEWTQIEDNDHKFLDIASHCGKFYAYDLSIRKVMVVDPTNYAATKSLAMKFINGPPLLDEHLDKEHVYGLFLVAASNGRLYLVIWVHEPTDKMVVYVLKEDEQQQSSEGNISSWEQVMSLGDQILFIGTDVSFSLPSSSEHLPQWKSSSICLFMQPTPLIFNGYIEDDMPEGVKALKLVHYPQYFRYFMLYDMEKEDGSMVPFEELSKQVYTGVFFPPPAWVKWHCPNLGNVEVRLDQVGNHDYIDEDYEDCDDDDGSDSLCDDIDNGDSVDYDEMA